MKKMTERFLREAFAGESQAHMKYILYAKKAEEEGFKNVARLFRAIAFAEEIHAFHHFRVLGQLGSTADNLQDAINGENFEIEEMYPAYENTATLQKEENAQKTFKWALEAEKVHSSLYSKAKEAVTSGKDFEVGDIYICPFCGWTVTENAPERCPLCGATKEKFVKF